MLCQGKDPGISRPDLSPFVLWTSKHVNWTGNRAILTFVQKVHDIGAPLLLFERTSSLYAVVTKGHFQAWANLVRQQGSRVFLISQGEAFATGHAGDNLL